MTLYCGQFCGAKTVFNKRKGIPDADLANGQRLQIMLYPVGVRLLYDIDVLPGNLAFVQSELH